MKLRWISPLDPRETEIARYSAGLMPTLQGLVEVESVEDARGGDAPDWWTPPAATAGESETAGEAPLPVYHIGNNPCHLPVHELACREPGLVVLHDLSLVDLARYLSHDAGRPELWKQLMLRQYGDEVRGLVNRSEKSSADYIEMIARFPLFLPFVQNALGVLVHSRYAFDALRDQLAPATPLLQLSLPFHAREDPAERNYQARPLRFVFCGHVGANRRLLEFFEAWGRLENPGAIALELFGNIHNRGELQQYAEHFGVADFLHISGYVEEAQLEKALQSAHFAINLRWPTMGEASASQLRYWSAALPTLVTDVGWYGEVPDDTVCKISRQHEIDDIAALLQDALLAPDKYSHIGQRGLEHLRASHRAQDYALALASFAGELVERRLAFRAIDQQLVSTIASLCEDESDTVLFRGAIETSVATFEPDTTKLEEDLL